MHRGFCDNHPNSRLRSPRRCALASGRPAASTCRSPAPAASRAWRPELRRRRRARAPAATNGSNPTRRLARIVHALIATAAAEAGDTASKCNRVELRVMPPVVDDDDALARRTRDPDASSCARRSRPRSFAMRECRAGARNTELRRDPRSSPIPTARSPTRPSRPTARIAAR